MTLVYVISDCSEGRCVCCSCLLMLAPCFALLLQMMLEDLSAREATMQAELAKKEVKEELLKEELAREMTKQLVQAPTQVGGTQCVSFCSM